jgi:hypothetical protein
MKYSVNCNGGDERNDCSNGEPDAGQREQRRARRADALGLGGKVVRRPFGTRAVIARGLLIPRRISHDANATRADDDVNATSRDFACLVSGTAQSPGPSARAHRALHQDLTRVRANAEPGDACVSRPESRRAAKALQRGIQPPGRTPGR